MIREVTMYQAVCDRCGKTDEQDDYAGWADADQAVDRATASGWEQIGSRLLCLSCWCWTDDEEGIVEKPIEVTA